MTLFSLLLPLATAGLGRDLEQTCERLAAGPYAAPVQVLRAERFGGLCGQEREGLDSAAARERLSTGRLDAPGTFSSWSTWLELRFDRRELDKLIFAQANLVKLDLDSPDAMLADYAPYLWFHVLHQAIDERELEREIVGEPAFEGLVDELLLEVYAWQKQQHARLQQLRTQLATSDPELGRVFDVAESAWLRHERERKQHPTFTRSLDALTRALVDGGKPMCKTCEASILAFHAQSGPALGWDSILMQTSTHVAAACARVREDTPLRTSFTLMLDDRIAVLGPLSAIVRDVNAYLAALTSRGGAPALAPALPLLRSGETPDGPFEEESRSDWGYRRARVYTVTGPLPITSVKRVSYRGDVPYLLVTTGPVDEQVANVDCAEEQDGWEVRSGRVQPRMVEHCQASAGTHLHQVDTQQFLVPEAYGNGLAAGQWVRWKGYTVPLETKSFSQPVPERAPLVVPIFVAPSLPAFTEAPSRLGSGKRAAPVWPVHDAGTASDSAAVAGGKP